MEGVNWYAVGILLIALAIPVTWFLMIAGAVPKPVNKYEITPLKEQTSVANQSVHGMVVTVSPRPDRDRVYPTFTVVPTESASVVGFQTGYIDLALSATFKAGFTGTPLGWERITPVYITRGAATAVVRSPTSVPVVVTRVVPVVTRIVVTSVVPVPVPGVTTVYVPVVVSPTPAVVPSVTPSQTATMTPTELIVQSE